MSLDRISSSAEAPARHRLRIPARLLRRLLPQTDAGSLRVDMPDGDRIEFRGAAPGPEASLTIRRWRCLWRLIAGGEVGFADSYMDGDWTTTDLTRVLAWAAHNENSLRRLSGGPVTSRLMGRLTHLANANTMRGSRRNIAAHYDLGNEFYSCWLDPGMSYSSALYRTRTDSLSEAQEAKIDRVISLLEISGGEKVLEIGIGWGGVIERLARRHQCHAIGVTLSARQLAYARERLARGGLDAQADLRLQDYRDIGGRFDRIVSIEMLEAVGERYWAVYFAALRDRLTSTGVCVLQAITIAEDRFEGYRRTPDFIQRYIFPGGMLPTKAIVRREAERAGLTLVTQESFGESYALTLQEWRRRFVAAWPAIERLGFDIRFRRMWEYYLSYCEAGFLNQAIDVSLFKLRA